MRKGINIICLVCLASCASYPGVKMVDCALSDKRCLESIWVGPPYVGEDLEEGERPRSKIAPLGGGLSRLLRGEVLDGF